MSIPASLRPALEEVVQHGSAEKRAETLLRITGLFLDGAANFNDEQVALFDDVIGCLIEGIDNNALAELARRLAPASQSPAGVLRALANHDDIEVAGPVLRQAKLDDADLKSIAERQSQAHLLALTLREAIGEQLADILVARGDREVAASIVANQGAQLSENAFATLVQQAKQDSALAENLSLRTDMPPDLFRQLLLQGSDLVQKRLRAQAVAESRDESDHKPAIVEDAPAIAPATITGADAGEAAPRDYSEALAAVRALHQERKLGEVDIAEFATSGKYEETIAALATVCEVPVEVVDRLMSGERVDPVLILARAAGFEWQTARAIMGARPGAKLSHEMLDTAFENFERLSAATAQRVVRFWQVRQGTGA